MDPSIERESAQEACAVGDSLMRRAGIEKVEHGISREPDVAANHILVLPFRKWKDICSLSGAIQLSDEKVPLFLRAAGKFRLCESSVETGRLSAAGQEFIRRRFAMRRFAALFVSMFPFVAVAADIPDLAFYRDAAEGGLAEVAMGTMAQQQAHSQSVREFGALMVKDHSAANEKLKAIAESKNITLPANTSVDEMAAKEKLRALSGSSFDKSYIKGMIKDHQEDIAEFKKEATSGRDPDARAFAAATLPTLEAHLKKIQSIAAEAGVSADKAD